MRGWKALSLDERGRDLTTTSFSLHDTTLQHIFNNRWFTHATSLDLGLNLAWSIDSR